MSEVYNYQKHTFKDRDGDTPGTKLNSQLFNEMETGIENSFNTLSSHNERITILKNKTDILQRTVDNSNLTEVPTKLSAFENDKNYISSDAEGNVSVAKLFQGNSSPDESIANMNRFQTDLYIQGDGSAPNNPRIAGFYMGKSQTDENRHMDIVSGEDYSYIDFNKANREVDYDIRLIANVENGLTEMKWGTSDALTNKIFNIQGILQENGARVLTLDGGIMTGKNGIQYPIISGNAQPYFISAGGDYTANSGKYGVKLVCCDQSDCQSGVGQDLSNREGGYDLSVVTGASSTGHCTLSFVSHPVNSKVYTTLGYFTEGGNFYTSGNIYESGIALSNKYASLNMATQSTNGLMSSTDKKKLDDLDGASGVSQQAIADIINTEKGAAPQAIVDLIYPIGSIYMSVNSTSPATLFGGTWVQLKDGFLVSAGYNSIAAGATGGSKDAIVVSHDHTFTGTQGTTSSNGDHYHSITHRADWDNITTQSAGAFFAM